MKKRALGFLITAALLVCTTALAQESKNPARPTTPPTRQDKKGVDESAPTESMWFYLHEQQRYDDPQVVIRRRAEWKSQQRRMRLEAQKWYGYSASRPIANPIPFMGVYSPMWVGTGIHPYHWVGGGLTTSSVRVSAQVETETSRR